MFVYYIILSDKSRVFCCFIFTIQLDTKRHEMWHIISAGMYNIQSCERSGKRNSFEPPHDKTNKMAYATSKDSDQPSHLPSLIRVFAVCVKKPWVLSYPLRRLWTNWGGDAQADLSLCRVPRSFCWFCHEAAQFYCWGEFWVALFWWSFVSQYNNKLLIYFKWLQAALSSHLMLFCVFFLTFSPRRPSSPN